MLRVIARPINIHTYATNENVGLSLTRPMITRELVLDTALMAVRRRLPRRVIIRSQYGSDDWRRFRNTNHFEPSMSRRGNCWDIAVAESFFSSLKKERIRKNI